MSFYLVILKRSTKSLFLVIFKAFRISILDVFVIFRRVQVFDFCISISVPLTKLILRLVLGSHATVPAMQQLNSTIHHIHDDI